MGKRTIDQLPTARVVKQAPGQVSRRSVKAQLAERWAPMQPAMHTAAAVVVGLWPIFALIAMAVAFGWAAGFRGAP